MGKTKLIILIAAIVAVSAMALPAPARAAEQAYVMGTVRMESGFYTYGKVYPLSVIGDQFFQYWVGLADGKQVIFDQLGQIWYPAPVQYQRSSIVFRGMPLDGFVRVWGRSVPYIDGSYFFGVDGMVYKLVKKYKRVGLAGNRHRRLKASYYVNMVTKEQSNWAPRNEEELAYYKSLLPGANGESGEAFPIWAQADQSTPPPSTEPLKEAPGDEEDIPTPSEVVQQATGTGEGTSSGENTGTGEGSGSGESTGTGEGDKGDEKPPDAPPAEGGEG
jgi:hypothetical protein